MRRGYTYLDLVGVGTGKEVGVRGIGCMVWRCMVYGCSSDRDIWYEFCLCMDVCTDVCMVYVCMEYATGESTRAKIIHIDERV